MIEYLIYKNCLKIKDSYKVTDPVEMSKFLNDLKKVIHEDACNPLFKRSLNDLREEWEAHNLLYSLNLFRTHTKSVDLEMKDVKYQWIWKILSWFY